MTDLQRDEQPPADRPRGSGGPDGGPGVEPSVNNHYRVRQTADRGGTNVVGPFRDIVMNGDGKVSVWAKVPVLIGVLSLVVVSIVGWDKITNFFDRTAHQPPVATATIAN